MSVLVEYATAHGATRSIAQHVASTLTELGHPADAIPLADVEDVGPYEAFVLGSAVHNRAWLVEAREFLTSHRDGLHGRPVWLFSAGMPAALRGPWRRLARREEPAVAAPLRKDVTPRGHRLFSGVIRREHISLPGHLLFTVMGCR